MSVLHAVFCKLFSGSFMKHLGVDWHTHSWEHSYRLTHIHQCTHEHELACSWGRVWVNGTGHEREWTTPHASNLWSNKIAPPTALTKSYFIIYGAQMSGSAQECILGHQRLSHLCGPHCARWHFKGHEHKTKHHRCCHCTDITNTWRSTMSQYLVPQSWR